MAHMRFEVHTDSGANALLNAQDALDSVQMPWTGVQTLSTYETSLRAAEC